MILSRRATVTGPIWFADDRPLNPSLSLAALLAVPREEMLEALAGNSEPSSSDGHVLSPAEDGHEIWAAGVTYLRSRNERQAESTVADVYGKVYEADRPELFFKALGWRSIAHGKPIRIRKDSDWNVPEPELTLVVNRLGEVIGYTAGNDVSSRAIEGENPLYLPQAKSYDGSCAVGPSIVIAGVEAMADLGINCTIQRAGETVFSGDARTSQMKRGLQELVDYLFAETSFPNGVFLMTGTGIVPAHPFTLLEGDVVSITVGELNLVNEVASNR